MPVYRLDDERIWFPPPEGANEDGIVAVGGDLRPERLLFAYQIGIFPWYHEGLPIIWHSPDPRMVLEVSALHVPRSLAKTIRRGAFTLSADRAFAQVIDSCAAMARPGQDGTWITTDMRAAYLTLHELGFAHSFEAWHEGQLAGGLYGVSLGDVFFGESMFAHMAEASKVAFVASVAQLGRWGTELVDCQVHTEHLERFGAVEWPRARYLEALARLAKRRTRRGAWRLDGDLAELTAWPPSTGG